MLADEILAPINNGTATPHSTMELGQFVESSYLPFVESHKRPSTYRGYPNMWKRYLEPRRAIVRCAADFRKLQMENAS